MFHVLKSDEISSISFSFAGQRGSEGKLDTYLRMPAPAALSALDSGLHSPALPENATGFMLSKIN